MVVGQRLGARRSAIRRQRSRPTQTTAVTGVATTVQTRTFTVRARDQAGNTATKTFTLTVDPPSPLIINNGTDVLTSGRVGVAYNNGLFPLGGTPPWSWSYVSGTLPPGLSIQASPGRVLGRRQLPAPTRSPSGSTTVVANLRPVSSRSPSLPERSRAPQHQSYRIPKADRNLHVPSEQANAPNMLSNAAVSSWCCPHQDKPARSQMQHARTANSCTNGPLPGTTHGHTPVLRKKR